MNDFVQNSCSALNQEPTFELKRLESVFILLRKCYTSIKTGQLGICNTRKTYLKMPQKELYPPVSSSKIETKPRDESSSKISVSSLKDIKRSP